MQSIYLDNAATTFPKPPCVYELMATFFRERAVSPGRATYDAGVEVEQMVHATRTQLATCFGGGSPKRLTFAYNASDALNMIIFGMLDRGDHVVTTTLEHNSVLRPLRHRTVAGDIEVTHVPADRNGYVDPDDIARAFRTHTRMVIVNHASNVLGTVQPIAEIGRRCRDAGVPFVVDVSQSAGVVPIDMTACGVDAIAFTGHKSLLGPPGIGGVCVLDHVDIRTTRFGGTGVDSANPLHLEQFPYRLECGTLNTLGVAGLHAAQTWLAEQGSSVRDREDQLRARLVSGLREIDGIQLYGVEGDGPHIGVLSCNVRGWNPADVGAILDVDHGIAVRTGLQCAPLVHEQLGTAATGTVRFSVGPFNTIEHIDHAVAAMREIAATPLSRGRQIATEP